MAGEAKYPIYTQIGALKSYNGNYYRGTLKRKEPEQWIDETVLFLKKLYFIKEVFFTRINDDRLHHFVTYQFNKIQ